MFRDSLTGMGSRFRGNDGRGRGKDGRGSGNDIIWARRTTPATAANPSMAVIPAKPVPDPDRGAGAHSAAVIPAEAGIHRLMPAFRIPKLELKSVRPFAAMLLALAFAFGFVPEGRAANERWYKVELIVFERTGDGNLDDEVWLANPGRPPIDESVGLGSASERAQAGDSGQDRAAASRVFRLLDPRHHRLGGVYRRLRASPDYRPLLHVAWRQPGYPPRRARHVHILGWKDAATGSSTGRFEARARPVIDGTVRLYLRKFLHLNADLLYYRDDPRSRDDYGALSAAGAASGEETGTTPARPGPREPAALDEMSAASVSPLPDSTSPGNASTDAAYPVAVPGGETGLARAGDAPASENIGPPLAYRMTASRRMRPGELHYLDHPLFGLLVRVTRS